MLKSILDPGSRPQLRALAGLTAVLMLSSTMMPVANVYAEAAATDSSVTSSDVTAALSGTAGILSASDSVATVADGDSAMIATTDGAKVDIPKNPSDPVALGLADNSSPPIAIDLPSGDTAADAQKVAPGVVAYPNDNGSASAVQAVEDGSLRMLTIIDNASAPDTYDYKVTLPGGGHVELVPDGSAIVLDNDGQITATASAPWAKDANGKIVPTYFSTDGSTLTQHVKHQTAGVVYPVTADPWWAPARVDHVTWVNTKWGRSLHVYMTWYGYTTSFLVPGTAFDEVMQKAHIGWSGSMYNQFVCHADLAPPWKESWNLDTWRPDVGLWQTLLKKCNP